MDGVALLSSVTGRNEGGVQESRAALHQIAPLVVHAIKFGGGYVEAATRAIEQYA